jgi:hypothetical protein
VARGEGGTPEQQPTGVHFQAVMVAEAHLCCAIEAWKSCLSCVACLRQGIMWVGLLDDELCSGLYWTGDPPTGGFLVSEVYQGRKY